VRNVLPLLLFFIMEPAYASTRSYDPVEARRDLPNKIVQVHQWSNEPDVGWQGLEDQAVGSMRVAAKRSLAIFSVGELAFTAWNSSCRCNEFEI
jgi:hypothetical protein